MWEKYSLINDDNLDYFQELHDKKILDWYNNQFHLSGFCGSLNDPNGLIFIENKYYIFFQNCPFSIQHFNKSWGLYTTTDFVNYKYEGIILTPSNKYDKHGVYSGSARINSSGEMEIYYTGNVKLNMNKRTSYTMKAMVDFKNKIVKKKMLFECNLEKYTGHFRDPVVFAKNKKIFMLNGAQTNKNEGVFSLYNFENDKWIFKSDFLFEENNQDKSYMIECPNYFKIQDKEFLLACSEKNEALIDNGHFVEYREVKFQDDDSFKFLSNTKKIDLGYDFYAPQIFSNTKKRTILLGWLGNSKSNPFPKEISTWSNQMTVPRELFLVDNSLHQMPIKELENLRTNEIAFVNNEIRYENGTIEFISKNINNKNFQIKIIGKNNKMIEIKNENENLIINRSEASYLDEENLPSFLKFSNLKIDDIKILLDRSCLEMFINNGQNVISVRFYVENHNKLITNLENNLVYQLKSNNYNWNNILFKNELEEV